MVYDRNQTISLKDIKIEIGLPCLECGHDRHHHVTREEDGERYCYKALSWNETDFDYADENGVMRKRHIVTWNYCKCEKFMRSVNQVTT